MQIKLNYSSCKQVSAVVVNNITYWENELFKDKILEWLHNGNEPVLASTSDCQLRPTVFSWEQDLMLTEPAEYNMAVPCGSVAILVSCLKEGPPLRLCFRY